jgi:hypothetical protein
MDFAVDEAPEAGAPDVEPFALPDGLTPDALKKAVDLIWDWEENETDSDPVALAIAIFGIYAKGHAVK